MDLSTIDLTVLHDTDGGKCFLTRFRCQLSRAAQDEVVRQRVILYPSRTLRVPVDMSRVEQPLSTYARENAGRADIVIRYRDKESNSLLSLCVIECKAPHRLLEEEAVDQL